MSRVAKNHVEKGEDDLPSFREDQISLWEEATSHELDLLGCMGDQVFDRREAGYLENEQQHVSSFEDQISCVPGGSWVVEQTSAAEK